MPRTARTKLRIDELFPDAPLPTFELFPDPSRGARLRIFPDVGFFDVDLSRSLVVVVLILLRALQAPPAHTSFPGWVGADALLQQYRDLHSKIQPSGIPRNVRLINHAIRQALKARGYRHAGVQIIATDHSYQLAVPNIRRLGALEDLDLNDDLAVKRLLALA